MFRTLSEADAKTLFKEHPARVAALIEAAWEARSRTGPVGPPDNRSDLPGLGAAYLNPTTPTPISISNFYYTPTFLNAFSSSTPRIYDHLIYAYMIENTRIVEIFRRVVREFAQGERLGSPSEDTQKWLRITEDLFFRDPTPFGVTSLVSHVRPDSGANRRNAYHRMFGMDLNHGTDQGTPFSYFRADASNQEFVNTLEELLREAWIGKINVGNNSGAKPTDNPKIDTLRSKLREMLLARRLNGNLAREEFSYVAMMSWFHLSVRFDSPVITDLRAQATSDEQRLFKVAEFVRLSAHGLSRSYFRIAERISNLLILIEADVLTAGDFYNPGPIADEVAEIVTEWSTITGRDLKGQRVLPYAPTLAPIPSSGRAVPIPSAAPAAPSVNGGTALPAPVANRLAGVEAT